MRELVENLRDATLSGEIMWNPSNNMFNSDTKQQFSAQSADIDTTFDLNVELEEKSGSYTLSNGGSLSVNNKNLPGGVEYVSSYTNDTNVTKAISEIKNFIYKSNTDKFKCLQKNKQQVLDNITKTLSKTIYRDKKLNNILDKENSEAPITKPEENKGFFDKFFK